MKSLDEVIKALEWCISDDDSDECAGCPYDGEEEGCRQRNLDALHYLRELKEARAIIATARDEARKEIDAIRILAINSMANQCESCPWRKNEKSG